MIRADEYLTNKAKLAFGAAAFVYYKKSGTKPLASENWYIYRVAPEVKNPNSFRPGRDLTFDPFFLGVNFKQAKQSMQRILDERRKLGLLAMRMVVSERKDEE